MPNRKSRPWAEGWEELSIGELADKLRPFCAEVDQWLTCARLHPEERDFVRECMIDKCQQLGLSFDDAFEPYPPLDRLGEGKIVIGPVEPFERVFRCSPLDFSPGTGLWGEPGSGKSTAAAAFIEQLCRLGYGVVVVERRGDLLGLAQRLANALIVPVKRDRHNLLQPPPNVPTDGWLAVMAALLTVFFLMQAPGKMFAYGLLMKVWELGQARGVTPSLIDFLEHVQQQKQPRGSSQENFQLRLLDRVNAVRQVCGEDVLAVQAGFPLLQMAEKGRPVFIDARGIDSTIADFWCAARVVFPLCYSRLYSRNPFGQRPIMIVCDEARSLIRARDAAELPPFEELVNKLRALNLTLLTCEQVPSEISRAVAASLRFRLGFRCSPPESHAVSDLLGLTRQQAEELPHLPTGTAIVRLGGDRICVPFRVRVQPGSVMVGDLEGEVAIAGVEAVIERSIAELTPFVVPRVPLVGVVEAGGLSTGEPPAQDAEPLTRCAIEIARAIWTRPWETNEEREERLGIDRHKHYRGKKLLFQYGLIRRAGTIRKQEFYDFTDKGNTSAARLGFPTIREEGGTMHRVGLKRSERAWSISDPRISLTRAGAFNDVRYDSLAKTRDGLRIPLQICSTNSVGYEAERLLRLGEVAEVDGVVMITIERSKVRSLENALRVRLAREGTSEEEAARLLAKILIYDAETALKAGFNWRGIVDRFQREGA